MHIRTRRSILNTNFNHPKLKTVKELISLLQESPVEKVESEATKSRGIVLDIKRDDKIHPIISGNKWRKLKYLLLDIENKGYTRLASMGGPHSNFLHALAYVCFLLDWECQFFVRGYVDQPLTPTLIDCLNWGAEIKFVDREVFRKLREQEPKLHERVLWVKEGGRHSAAMSGVSEIFTELDKHYDYICTASATGTSVAGLISGANKYQPQSKILGISVLNNQQQQVIDVNTMVKSNEVDWEIISGYEFGGFAKKNQELSDFSNSFMERYGIPIEPIYSGRSFLAVFDMLEKGVFETGSKILLIHCGGLQGARKQADCKETKVLKY